MMTPDEKEALSRKYGRDVIILLPLRSGKFAVFNSARELCAIEGGPDTFGEQCLEWIVSLWRAPALRIESYRSMAEEDADELLKEAGL
jgi:hypothetical protein